MIRDLVTRGYSNGTFTSTIGFAVTRGYNIGAAIIDVIIDRINIILNIKRSENISLSIKTTENIDLEG